MFNITKHLLLLIILFLLFLTPLYAVEGMSSSTVPVRFSFGKETTTHVEFGFTRNAVTDMGTIITDVNSVEIIETANNSRKYTLPDEFFAYLRLLAATDYTMSLRHTGYLDDADSADPTDIIPFTLVCGSTTIPANTDTVIFTHSGSVTPTVQSKPIKVDAVASKINSSFYVTTLTLTLTAVE